MRVSKWPFADAHGSVWHLLTRMALTLFVLSGSYFYKSQLVHTRLLKNYADRTALTKNRRSAYFGETECKSDDNGALALN
jgi:hypothetical protein